MENQPENGHTLQKFTWTIKEFSRLKTNKLYSECFLLGGYTWRILLFAKKNGKDHLSLYLDVPNSLSLPYGWTRDVRFSLALMDQVHGRNTIRKETKLQFSAVETYRGFMSFVPLSELFDPKKGYLLKDTCIIEAEVFVPEIGPEKVDLFTSVKVAQDKDLMEQIGTYICLDLVDFSKVRSFRVHSQTPFNLFKVVVANEFGFPVQLVRFWIWAKRQNLTFRPDRPLTEEEEEQPVENLQKVDDREVRLFMEVEFGLDLHPISPPNKTKNDILLFFKLYDPEKEQLRYAGRLFVKQTATPMQIIEKLNQMVGFSSDEGIELYEEIKFEPDVMCVLVSKELSFQASQLTDGDILCFQKSPPGDGAKDCLFPDVPSFLEHMHNRQIVSFRSLERPNEDGFYLKLSKVHSYDDIVERLACQIGLDDPSKIRLTSYNCFSQQPNPDPIRYRGVKNLLGMLVNCNQTSDILYYEVLDIPLPQFQDLKYLRVAFYYATKNEVVNHNIRMPKQSTVGDMINQLKTKIQLSHPDTHLRLLQVINHKIYKIYPFNEKIENISGQCTLRVVEIPEEKNLGPLDILIHVCHFFKETGHNQMKIKIFGEPFILVIHEGDTLAEVKVQIQSKLHVSEKEFCKWKFAYLSLDHPEYLQDSDALSSRFQRKDVCSWDQILGLEHSVNDPRIAYALDQVCTADPAIPKKPEEVPTNPTGYSGVLVDFRGLVKIEKAFVPLLKEVCTWYPTLIECQKKRSGMFKQWAFTALGQVLHFLKTTKAKDMTEGACQHLQVLWEELESSRFDLTWLEPHVQYALGMKSYCEKAEQVKKLKDNVEALELQTRRLRAKLKILELALELAKSKLAKAEEGFEVRDVDTLLGYGSR